MGKLKQKWEPNEALDKKGVKTTFGLRMREFSHLAKRRARACTMEEKRRLVGFCALQGFYSS